MQCFKQTSEAFFHVTIGQFLFLQWFRLFSMKSLGLYIDYCYLRCSCFLQSMCRKDKNNVKGYFLAGRTIAWWPVSFSSPLLCPIFSAPFFSVCSVLFCCVLYYIMLCYVKFLLYYIISYYILYFCIIMHVIIAFLHHLKTTQAL